MKFNLLTVSCVSLSFQAVNGWSTSGHEIVATVAHRFMTNSAKIWVRSHIGGGNALESMCQASVWADTEADTSEYHFVHTPYRTCLTYDESRDCGFENSGKCLVTGISKYVEDIVSESSSRKETKIGIKMLIHLVADLHQPVHVGFAKDHGAVDIVLSSPITGSLHELWDRYLTEGIVANDFLATPTEDLVLMSGIAPEADVFELDNVESVHDWVATVVSTISSSYSCPKAYQEYPGQWISSLDSLSPEYLASRREIARQLLIQAGIRLGKILNQAWTVWDKRSPKSTTHQVSESSSANQQFNPSDMNPFESLTIDDLDLDTLVEEPVESGAADSESVPSRSGRSTVEPFIWEGQEISSIRFWEYDQSYVITRSEEVISAARRAEIWLAMEYFTVYQVTFALNKRTVLVFIDTNAFPAEFVSDMNFVKSLLYRLKNKRWSKVSANNAAASQLREFASWMPSFVVYDPLDKEENGHWMSLFHTRLNLDTCSAVRISSTDEARIITANKIARAKFKSLSLEDGLVEFYKQDIARKCPSIAKIQVDDIIFATTTKAIEKSPVRAHVYFAFVSNVRFTTLFDLNLLPIGLTPELDALIAACIDRNGPTPIMEALQHRPTIFNELLEIKTLLTSVVNGQEPERPKIVDAVNTFESPFLNDGTVLVEWSRQVSPKPEITVSETF